MSERTEKIVKIILPDLLNYLEMVESGEIIEKRLQKILPHNQKQDDEHKDDKIKNQLKLVKEIAYLQL